MLERIRDELADVAIVEQFPKMEGRQLIMVLAPKKKDLVVKKKADARPEAKPALAVSSNTA